MSTGGEASVGLSVAGCLDAISARLSEAAAIAKAARACAAAGSEREAVRIALDLDERLSETVTLHNALCLVARLDRPRTIRPGD